MLETMIKKWHGKKVKMVTEYFDGNNNKIDAGIVVAIDGAGEFFMKHNGTVIGELTASTYDFIINGVHCTYPNKISHISHDKRSFKKYGADIRTIITVELLEG